MANFSRLPEPTVLENRRNLVLQTFAPILIKYIHQLLGVLKTNFLSLSTSIDNPTSATSRKFMTVATVDGTYTITPQDEFIRGITNAFTITLPTAGEIEGRVYTVKNIDSTSVTLAADGSETIDGAASVVLLITDNITVVSDGTNWAVI